MPLKRTMRKKKGLLGTGLPLLLRQVLNIGPAKVSLTGSGVGVSVGVPGARGGIDAQGRKYLSVSLGGFTKRIYIK